MNSRTFYIQDANANDLATTTTLRIAQEGRANANIMAAAPELLAAAQEAWEELAQCRQNSDVDRVMNQLHAAITKAGSGS